MQHGTKIIWDDAKNKLASIIHLNISEEDNLRFISKIRTFIMDIDREIHAESGNPNYDVSDV